MIRNSEAIDDAMTALKEDGLVLKAVEGLQDYLFCKVKFSADRMKAWLGEQPRKKFGI